VRVPPLRERPGDVALLAEHFLLLSVALGSTVPRLTEGALALLCAHDWPGNVRELRNLLERAVSLSTGSDVIDADALDIMPRAPPHPSGWDMQSAEPELAPFKTAKDRLLERWERAYLQRLMSSAQNNVSAAAKRAGIARGHLHRLLRKHGLTR
jgi:DNA-binding NtrC family response regulator